jgi:hypothetical protein
MEIICPVLDQYLEPCQDLTLAANEAKVFQRLFGKV